MGIGFIKHTKRKCPQNPEIKSMVFKARQYTAGTSVEETTLKLYHAKLLIK